MFSNILVPVDGSESAERALALGAEIAVATKAKLAVIHVLAYDRLPPDMEHFLEVEHIAQERAPVQLGQRVADAAQAEAKKLGVGEVRTIVVEGDPAEQIVAASADVDLIVMGSRGLGAAKGLLMGSVSSKVQQLADCPCMTTK